MNDVYAIVLYDKRFLNAYIIFHLYSTVYHPVMAYILYSSSKHTHQSDNCFGYSNIQQFVKDWMGSGIIHNEVYIKPTLNELISEYIEKLI